LIINKLQEDAKRDANSEWRRVMVRRVMKKIIIAKKEKGSPSRRLRSTLTVCDFLFKALGC
jgi:hypothetical protein